MEEERIRLLRCYDWAQAGWFIRWAAKTEGHQYMLPCISVEDDAEGAPSRWVVVVASEAGHAPSNSAPTLASVALSASPSAAVISANGEDGGALRPSLEFDISHWPRLREI